MAGKSWHFLFCCVFSAECLDLGWTDPKGQVIAVFVGMPLRTLDMKGTKHTAEAGGWSSDVAVKALEIVPWLQGGDVRGVIADLSCSDRFYGVRYATTLCLETIIRTKDTYAVED